MGVSCDCTVRSRAADGDDTFQHLRVFEDVVSLILNNYVEDPKVDNVMEGAMRGLADSLDPASIWRCSWGAS